MNIDERSSKAKGGKMYSKILSTSTDDDDDVGIGVVEAAAAAATTTTTTTTATAIAIQNHHVDIESHDSKTINAHNKAAGKINTTTADNNNNIVIESFEIGNINDDDDDHINNVPSATTTTTTAVNVEWTKGEVQEPEYRDKYFSIAFIVHFIIVLLCSIILGKNGIHNLQVEDETTSTSTGTGTGNRILRFLSDSFENFENNNNNGEEDNGSWGGNMDDDTLSFSSTNSNSNWHPGVIWFLLIMFISFIGSPILSILTLELMKNNPIQLIKSSLYFSIGLNVIIVIIALVAGVIPSVFIHIVITFILVMYTYTIWNRIPYAASNLKAAVTAIKMNLGLTILSFSSIPLHILWFFIWIIGFMGVYETSWFKSQEHEIVVTDDFYGKSTTEEVISPLGYIVIIFFILSYYWTNQVIKNVIHTTISGVIGTWWFVPIEASNFCSKGIIDSLIRSLTHSFGSICFGSLLVAIIELLKGSLRRHARNRRSGLLSCIAQCLLFYIERLAEYFNRWAFVYVGLYGYSYVDAGKNVMTLFKQRGWNVLISDSLIRRTLSLVCFAIGLIIGIINVIISLFFFTITGSSSSSSNNDTYSDSDDIINGGSIFLSFFVGMVFGMLFSITMIGTLVLSSVDSIIVLFAEAPMEFQQNHPQLYNDISSTWTNAWPDLNFTNSNNTAATTNSFSSNNNNNNNNNRLACSSTAATTKTPVVAAAAASVSVV